MQNLTICGGTASLHQENSEAIDINIFSKKSYK